MWKLFYNIIVLPLLWCAFRILWLVNRKVRRGMRGRRRSMQRLKVYLRNSAPKRRLWIHASSMGEFEQAKPIIEALKREDPELAIVASFFSPSGYENNRRYTAIDALLYLPFDSARNARAFLELLAPVAAVFIRYDIWPNHIWVCQKLGIPIMLANATLRSNSPRLWLLSHAFHRQLFDNMSVILTVSEDDADNFRQFKLSTPKISTVGDTRYDRVAGKAAQARHNSPLPAHIRMGKRIVVFGSSWEEDEEIFLPAVVKLMAVVPDLLFIIVPHEPVIEHLEWLEYRFKGIAQTRRFSWITSWQNERILIVDSIGILLPLYSSADIAFVGGGFRSNVHNTLEPAAYGIPVLFGPKIANSREAGELVAIGGAFIVRSRQEVYRTLRRLLSDDNSRRRAGETAGNFVASRAGSTQHILTALQALIEKN